MTVPTLHTADTKTYNTGVTAATSHAIPYCTNISAGDLLVVMGKFGNATSTNDGGFTEAHDGTRITCLYKTASGSESGNLTLTTGSVRAVATMVRISGWSSFTAGTITNESLDAPSVTLPATDDYLFINFAGAQRCDNGFTNTPTGYGNTSFTKLETSSGSSTASNMTLVWGSRTATSTAGPENADAWTQSGTLGSTYAAVTLAIQGASASRTATPTASSGTPGSTQVVNLTGFGGTPTGVTFNGVSCSFTGNSSAVTVTLPALSTFVSAGTHAATRWDTNYTLTVSEAGGSANATYQIDPPDTDGPTYWFYAAGATPYPGDSVHPVGTAQNDDVFAQVATGTLSSISTGGATAWSAVPGQLLVRIYDVSGSSWSTVDTWNFTEYTPEETITKKAAQSIIKRLVRKLVG
jgi:hypothetical protein